MVHGFDLGGTVTETRYASVRYEQGPGVGTAFHNTRALVFDDCQLTATSVAGLDDGEYRLPGSVDLVKQHDSCGQASLEVSSVELASLFMARPDDGEIRTTGSRIESVNGRQFALRQINVALESR